jgi:hypothetical protein
MPLQLPEEYAVGLSIYRRMKTSMGGHGGAYCGPTFRRKRQEAHEFKASLDYIARSCLTTHH